MSKPSVPFTCIPNLSKEKLRLGDNLSFDLREIDGQLNISVEATRLGSDKRKITGWANMDQYQILRLWAGLDQLIKERGLTSEVQTEEQYAQSRIEQNVATQQNFQRHRQRMVLDHKRKALSQDQQDVVDYIITLEQTHSILNDEDSVSGAVEQAARLIEVTLTDAEHQAVCEFLMSRPGQSK